MFENTLDHTLLRKVVRTEHQKLKPERHFDLAGVKMSAEHEVYMLVFIKMKYRIRIMGDKDASAVRRNRGHFIPHALTSTGIIDSAENYRLSRGV